MSEVLKPLAAAAASREPRIAPLKRFQKDALDTAVQIIADTSEKIEADPGRRRDIALAQGVTLLRSPTASGKTLTVGRTMQNTVGALPRPTCWFWFAPFSGLVVQTKDALRAECPGLGIRDPKTDRSVDDVRDGDVFVMTWASVAAANKDSKLVRLASDDFPALDAVIAALRVEGFYIGAVVDEAHVNFGTSAKQAAAFYLDVLRPDFTILVTATPKDDELEAFRKAAKIGNVNRIEVSRHQVVSACLNKIGVKAVHFRAEEKDERLLDMQEVAVFAALERHKLIKASLVQQGISLVPLMLIQVDNAVRGESDPVQRVKDMLTDYGVNPSVVAVHTTGEPDPFFHTLAYDETKEILIFKMAAATGFDAPRAWTPVSLRQTIGPEFGLQILGRIMRVHQRLQPLHVYATNPPRTTANVLDYGYVFLANPGQQTGIVSAAEELKAIQDGIQTITDNVVIIDFGDSKSVLLHPEHGFAELLEPAADADPEQSLQQPLGGLSEPANDDLSDEQRTILAQARSTALRVQSLLELTSPPQPIASDALSNGGAPPPPPPSRGQEYPLRTDISFPRRLAREVMPKTMDGLVTCIGKRIEFDATTLNLIRRTRGKVVVTESDVFGTDRVTRIENVPISPQRIAQQAQLAFRFNESLDERELKPALISRLSSDIEKAGMDPMSDRELRRSIDLIGMVRPNLMHEACRSCLATEVKIEQDIEIPAFYDGPPNLEEARKSLYGVFPADMNNEEMPFARLLDEDETGTVVWWLRNVSMARWAVSIVLPNGERHFPDFVIGVDPRRRSLDHIALVEVKDDGRTGRLFSTKNTDKVRTEHSAYRSALMVFRDNYGEWINVAYRADLQRHVPTNKFKIEDLLFVN